MKIDKKSFLSLPFCLLLILGISGCVFNGDNVSQIEKPANLLSEINTMQSTSQAKLEISPSVEKTADGVKVTMRTILSNSGTSALWVNKRMLFNTVYAPNQFREVWFDVKAPDGKKLEFRCKVRAGAAREEHYILLEAGKSIERDIKISDCFEMTEKGEYEIKAYYQDGNKEVPSAPANSTHLKDELESRPIRVSI